jgi:BASS family bile acid:Na+ symporter
MNNLALASLVTITLFSLMLTIGINQDWKELTSIWKTRRRLLRSLVAVIVIVPLIAGLLIWLFALNPVAATGLALLASSPGAPLTTFRSKMAGADVRLVSSLQLTLAFLAIVVTPITLAVFNHFFDTLTDPIRFIYVLQQVAQVTFLPVAIGITLRKFAPAFTNQIQGALNTISNLLFLLLVAVVLALFLLSAELRAMLAIGWVPAIAIIILILTALACGHFLGGPEPEYRAGLAVASIARNIGLAVFIAGMSEEATAALPMILAYLLIGVVLGVPYSLISKRRIGGSG